ncbi:MAG TPA: NmrA/HSCARG family protein [Alphaproteobacteria bacterium]|nr:NmrA/HSCARG family protein [Alphaproteobacteria bacterium]
MSPPTILVVGATGRFAGLVVPELARRGANVRALVRDEAKIAVARDRGAREVAVGDLRDIPSLEAAADGADGVFHIGPAFLPDEAELGVRMVDVAKRAGVRRFVFSSVIQQTNTALGNHASKIPVEEALFNSGMQYTILHPANFFQNIGGAWSMVLETGTFAEPFPTDSRIARVDYRDVAEVAAIALTEDRLAYGSFELCAGMPDRKEIAAIMSAVLERPIKAAELTFGEWAAKAALPYGGEQLKSLARVHAHYARHGSGGNSLTLRAILGREPRSLRRYIEELASK